MRAVLAFTLAISLLCGCSESAPKMEVVVLAAVENVEFVGPDPIAGGFPQIVGVLPAGGTLPVSECRPRKGDIDVVVIFNGKPAVAWKGKYKLIRRAVDLRQDSAKVQTRSCSGLFIGL